MKYVYKGKDTFVWLPMGFGKSVCYEVLPFVFDVKLGRGNDSSNNAVIVVSPLVSLTIASIRSK